MPSIKMPCRRAHGFTLIELLVVISIITLLIAILLPALRKARVAAYQVTCTSGARQVQVASTVYGHDWHDFYANGNAFNAYHDVLVTGNYIGKEIFTAKGCPYGPMTYSSASGDPLRTGVAGYPARVSYGLNGMLQSGHGKPRDGIPYTGSGSFVHYGPQRQSIGRSEKAPTQTGVIFCSPTAWENSSNMTYDKVYRPLLHVLGYGISTSWEVPGTYFRHDTEGLPAVMADGHGEFLSANDITGGQAGPDVFILSPNWLRNYTNPGIMSTSFNPLYDGNPSILDG